MKFLKSLILGLAAVSLVSLSSCNDWLDINDNPNSGSSESGDYSMRLPWCQFYVNSAYQFAGSRSIYACGPFTTTSRTTRDGCSAQWEPTNSLNTTPYQWFFVGSAPTLKQLIKMADEAGAYHYSGAAHLLYAYGFMLMTDLYGEMPYYEAATDGIFTPKYDTGRTIFIECVKEIDKAIELLSKNQEPNTIALSAGDSWNGGNVNKWLKMAYLLKARWLNNLSKKPLGSYKDGKYDVDEILACLDKAQQSNDDNTVINHNDLATASHDVLGWDEPVDYAPLYSVQGMSTANRVTKQLVDNLTNFANNGIEDPRANALLPWAYSSKSDDSPAELKWSEDGKWRRSLGVDMHTLVRTEGAPYAQAYAAVETSLDAKGNVLDLVKRPNDITKVARVIPAGSWYCPAASEARWNDTVYVEMISGAKGYLGTKDLFYRKTYNRNPVEGSKVSSMFYTRPSSPGYVAMYHEACFIRAEVEFNRGNKAAAYEAYKKGIQASIEMMNEKLNAWINEDPSLASCPAFAPISQEAINNFLDNGIGNVGTLTLGMIMTQKQIAMLYSQQCWNDMRRYDYRKDVFLNWEIPAEYHVNAGSLKAIPEGQMWRRWRQCSHEINYNATQLQAIASEVPGATGYAWNSADDVWTIPVWWDSTQE